MVDCFHNSGKTKGIGFYRIPVVVTNQGEKAEELSRERRERWIAAISRDDITSKDVLSNERVCGRHFVSGQSAKPWDKCNVDWVPTLNLGKTKYQQENHDIKEARAKRAKERRKRSLERQEREAAEKRKKIDVSGLPVRDVDFSDPKEGSSKEIDSSEDIFDHDCAFQDHTCSTLVDSSTQTQVDVSEAMTQTEEFEYLFKESYKPIDRDFFDSDEKVRFYSGLPSMDILMTVLDFVSAHIKRRTQKLSLFQEMIIVLMKLRLNMPYQDLAYRFQVSVTTISRIFASWLPVMNQHLSPLIYWPERHQLWKTMPLCFQQAFGTKVTVVIDCFEIFIDKPTNLLARAQTFSSYKHHNTIKVLIGISPQGAISFVSEAWGGRTSDKFLTENCGILEKLLPGDMVMADRGFTITESVALKQARLMIPAYTKGREQLDPIDVEKTRALASVRIHVERVIGLLRRKYTILQSTLPTDFLNNDNGQDEVPIIDRIIKVCSALVNLCPPIVPFD